MKPLKPAEVLESTIDTAVTKSGGSFSKLFVLSILAGAFIAFAAEGSSMAAFNLLSEPTTYGVGKVLVGSVFGTGLMLVILAGGELFTGNTMIIAAVAEKKVTMIRMLRNWGIVYLGNLVGSLIIVYMIYASGLLTSGGDMLGAMTLKIAVNKVNLSFLQGFLLGIMCNWLVCLAVWLSYASESMIGKIFGIFFPVMLFATSGFEHSIANMYYIPAGILAKANETFVSLSGVTPDALSALTWSGFVLNNLIPVTLGNIVGGGVFVALAYWYAFKKA